MIPKTIRWRLPLSYALIALLTTLALGAILLTALQDFYLEQEELYLQQNAAAISEQLASVLTEQLPLPALASQLKGFAFLSQTRVQVLDKTGTVIADSGAIDEVGSNATLSIEVEVDGVAQAFSQTVGESNNTTTYGSTIIVEEGLFSRNVEETVTIEGGDGDSLISRLPAVGTPYGFGLGVTASDGLRSEAEVEQPILSLEDGLLGYVVLSQGPAYGRSVLTSVLWGWGMAGTIAVLLAAAVGWLISRRLSEPLVALTAVTAQMAEGDLSVRSAINRGDELGILSQSFNQMAGRVEETVKALGHFVADAAHEFRTPLTSLHTYLEICAADTDQDEIRVRLQQADAQVFRLLNLTNGLLDLARISTTLTVPSHHTVNITALVQNSSEPYASRAEQAGLTFTLHADKPLVVNGIAEQLQRAVQNLLDNAIKFTPEGGMVEISVQSEGDWACVAVRDTGIGIPEGDMEALFGRFHRGRNVADLPGNGLGLAIVKAVVAGHGGMVQLERLERGTAVTIQFPMAH
jgi:signal transduction histidine kinase